MFIIELKNKIKNLQDQIYQCEKEMSELYTLQFEAHNKLTQAIKKGVLIKDNCFVCDNPKSSGHHYDYKKPLNVQNVIVDYITVKLTC
jgi:hypothetical protein